MAQEILQLELLPYFLLNFLFENNLGYGGLHANGLYAHSFDDGQQKQSCSDIDECADGTANCGQNSDCINLEGSYECHCFRGYIRNSTYGGCLPVEGMCSDGTICDRNAICKHAGSNRYK